MAITTQQTGPNSAYITYQVYDSAANVATTIQQWIINQGWILYDASASSTEKAFVAPNLSGSYKFMLIGYNSTGVYVRVFEQWNAATHTGTNEVSYNGVNTSTYIIQPVNTFVGGQIYVFATPRYFLMYGWTQGGVWGDTTYNTWCGCFEFTKDSLDSRSTPQFGFATGFGLTGGFTTQGTLYVTGADNTIRPTAFNTIFNSSTTPLYTCFSCPRLASYSYTGIKATDVTSAGTSTGLTSLVPLTVAAGSTQTSLIVYSPVTVNDASVNTRLVSVGVTSVANDTVYCLYSNPVTVFISETNNTLTNNIWASGVWIHEMNNQWYNISAVKETRGQLYGIKFLQHNTGNVFDTINIPTDSNYLLTNSGTPTPHVVLTGGAESRNRFAIPL